MIIAQLETLSFIKLSEDISFFCKVNQYGIVIMYAFDKIVDAIKGRKQHKALVRDIDSEITEGLRTERKNRIERRAKKKEEQNQGKQIAHLLEEGKQEDEI